MKNQGKILLQVKVNCCKSRST